MTYPEMNDEIVERLQAGSSFEEKYAADRIEELERQLKQITKSWNDFEIRLEQISMLDPTLYQEIDDEFSEQIININIAIATMWRTNNA